MKSNDQLSKDVIISFLKNNKPFLKKEFGINKIALFGSYAREEQTSTSDIDLLIDILEPTLKKHCELKRFLTSNLNKKIDISYFKGMRSFIKKEIEKEIVYA